MTNNTEDVEQGINSVILLRTKIRNTLYNNEIGFSMAKAGDKTAEQMAEDLVEQLAAHAENLIQQEANRQKLELLDRLEATARTADNCTGDTRVVKMVFIGNERKKLEEAE